LIRKTTPAANAANHRGRSGKIRNDNHSGKSSGRSNASRSSPSGGKQLINNNVRSKIGKPSRSKPNKRHHRDAARATMRKTGAASASSRAKAEVERTRMNSAARTAVNG